MRLHLVGIECLLKSEQSRKCVKFRWPLMISPSTQLDDLEEVTVIIVSFNTRDLTLKALETLYANAGDVHMRVIVWDNASADSSADAITAAFPQTELIRSEENLGFAVANNKAAELGHTPINGIPKARDF